MSENNSGILDNVARLFADKQPTIIKEVVKGVSELVLGLGTFATDLRSNVAKFGTVGSGIHNVLAGIQD